MLTKYEGADSTLGSSDEIVPLSYGCSRLPQQLSGSPLLWEHYMPGDFTVFFGGTLGFRFFVFFLSS